MPTKAMTAKNYDLLHYNELQGLKNMAEIVEIPTKEKNAGLDRNIFKSSVFIGWV